IGNTAYALRDFGEAAQALRIATTLQPDSAIAHNNLADTLLQLNELDAALRYAQTAVWLGGNKQPAYAQTLTEIQTRIAARDALQPATSKVT
ncbi:tetratricopeptide repeat protein, partial [Klebsiella pneumoniae]|nr:tetratricopeptide repeat protein [Klebsiella pneumoniae]